MAIYQVRQHTGTHTSSHIMKGPIFSLWFPPWDNYEIWYPVNGNTFKLLFFYALYRKSSRLLILSTQSLSRRRWEIKSWSSSANLKKQWHTRSESLSTVMPKEFMTASFRCWVNGHVVLPNSNIKIFPSPRRVLQELTCVARSFETTNHHVILLSSNQRISLTGWDWAGGEETWWRIRIVSRDLWQRCSWG